MGKSLQTMRILWAALSSTPVFFWVALTVVTSRGFSGHPEPVTLVVMTFVAFSMAVMSFVVPRMVFLQATKARALEIMNEPDPTANTAFRDMVPTRRVFADRAKAISAATQLHQVRLILSLAMSETIALLGMVMGIQFQFDEPVLIPFFVVSLVLMLIRFPTESALITQLEKAYDAKLPA